MSFTMKKIVIISIILLISIPLFSCKNKGNNEPSIIWADDMVDINAIIPVEDGDKNCRLGFSIPYAYKNIDKSNGINGKVISINGENVAADMISLIDEDIPTLNDVTQKGYSIDLLGCIIKYPHDISSFKINEMTIEVYGMEQTIKFANPVQWSLANNDYDEMLSVTYPSTICAESNYTLEFYLTAYKNLKIKDCYFLNDSMSVDNLALKINEKDVSLSENNECNVLNGDHITIKVASTLDEHYRVATQKFNFVVEYITASNEIKKYIFAIGKQGVSDELDAEKMLNYLVEEK